MGHWRSWERATLAVWRSWVQVPYAPSGVVGSPTTPFFYLSLLIFNLLRKSPFQGGHLMYNTAMNNWKVKIEVDPGVKEPEITIRCSCIDEEVVRIQKLLTDSPSGLTQISFFKEDSEYFLPLDAILFFETDGGLIRAHTATEEFETKYKLYELEEMLPSTFFRISKSTILNTRKLYSITKNLAGASKIEFQGTYKTVYCSRNYYKALKEKLAP